MSTPFEQGSMFVGCNYWASHAGTNMWTDWRESVVREDMRRLKESGVAYLRVFPLWSDFQVIKTHCAGQGSPYEVRAGEAPLPFSEAGRAGVSEIMLARFGRLMDIAQENGVKLIVGIITGWMSGRLHVPEALQGRNPLTDPFAIRWELRFTRCMVRRFRKHPALLAWDLGNECNCMGAVNSADELYLWTACISNAIRAEDAAHPVISGMHGMRPMTAQEPGDQGELTDIVCTHPYPCFTEYCDTDPMDGMKSALHAAAESCMYAGLSGKPCFVEEIGTLGPMFATEAGAADYLRGMLLGVWRYDCRGLMWWCAFDQAHLTQTPYDWNAVERELGLLTTEREKPVAGVMKAFDAFLRRQPIDALPEREIDAVCVLTRGQNQWAAAYGSFLLACQAKLDLKFAWCDDELPQANAYMLPSLCGFASMPGHRMRALLERVRAGAALYISMDDALLSSFEALTGMRPRSREKRVGDTSVSVGELRFTLMMDTFVSLDPAGAEVVGTTDAGEPFMTRCSFGKGVVWLVNAPIERYMAAIPGMADGARSRPLYRLYRLMGLRSPARRFDCLDPLVGLSEFPAKDGAWLVVQNYAREDREITLSAPADCRISYIDSPSRRVRLVSCADGEARVFLPHHDGCLLRASAARS